MCVVGKQISANRLG